MVNDGLIAVDYFGSTTPEYYRLPETYSLSKSHIIEADAHENLVEKLYVALELTGALGTWIIPTDKDENGLKPDAVCVYQGKVIYWEVDRGTEDYLTPKGIKGKLDRYLKKSTDNPEIRFYVGFTTVPQYDKFGKLKRSDITRAKGILAIIGTYKRGDQFFVSPYKFALENITVEAFSTYLNPQGIAIADFR
jgi:hypothetical protein